MTDAEEARMSLQSSRLDQLANHMRKFDELYAVTFKAASLHDRLRLSGITKPRECEGADAVFDPYVIACELQEWADESTKENA